MERFNYSQRETILLGYNYNNYDTNNNNNSLIRRPSSTNPSTPQRNSDVDFNDVFGGPPRRSSTNEDRERGGCAWPQEGEKPVFGGEDSGNRRRYRNKSNDFFDDIFGGEESGSVSSTPKKRDGEGLASRVMSPARPLPSAVDPVGSSCLALPFRYFSVFTLLNQLPWVKVFLLSSSIRVIG
ncbi:hypothetical protein RJT34_08680 [Clitoria ternatea]|uniref:Uncharacterized protein n=1 Tax=Clitoria ternatea TaxID=43366 RepID=A0AAN9PSX2_CLITE